MEITDREGLGVSDEIIDAVILWRTVQITGFSS